MVQVKLVGMSMTSYCTKLRLSNKCNGSWVVSIKSNANFKFEPPTMFFVFFAKVVLFEVVHPDGVTPYKISRCHADWRKFCIHFRSLDVRHSGMAEPTRLKITESRSSCGITSLLQFIKIYFNTKGVRVSTTVRTGFKNNFISYLR
jgi:hypothetical protein